MEREADIIGQSLDDDSMDSAPASPMDMDLPDDEHQRKVATTDTHTYKHTHTHKNTHTHTHTQTHTHDSLPQLAIKRQIAKLEVWTHSTNELSPWERTRHFRHRSTPTRVLSFCRRSCV